MEKKVSNTQQKVSIAPIDTVGLDSVKIFCRHFFLKEINVTPTQAYELSLEKIEELRKKDIEVQVVPSESRNDKDAVEEYGKQEKGIPPEKWIHVTFKFSDKIQSTMVHEMANYLGMCGITFDTGGWHGYRDWELDWSFKYSGKENEEQRDARDEVEDMINKIDDGEKNN